MLTLYYKDTCQFCKKVRLFADVNNLELELKDIYTNEENRRELIERGGKLQVPYLVDTEHGLSMYESKDIIKHLENKHVH